MTPGEEEMASRSAGQRRLLPEQSGEVLFLIVQGRKGRAVSRIICLQENHPARLKGAGELVTCRAKQTTSVWALPGGSAGQEPQAAGARSTGRERGQAGCES